MSIVICAERRNGNVDMLIVLDDDSMERIRQHDQFELQWSELPAVYSSRRPQTIGVVWASNHEQARLVELIQQDKQQQAMEYATRGFQYQPEKGDHDFGPTVIGRKDS